MMAGLSSAAGLARSLVIYYSRPMRIAGNARFYRQFLKEGDLAFDIGGHVGNRSLALARAGARVVTLEPQPLFHRLLARTMPSRVTVLPLAAGPACTKGQLAISRLHPTVSTLREDMESAVGKDRGFNGVVWDDALDVEMTTLDALVAEFGTPAFVKIDVEGFEDQVLAGLSRPLPVVAFEYLPVMRDVAHRAVDRLAALGQYEFNTVSAETARFAQARWLGTEEMHAVLDALDGAARSGDIYARHLPAAERGEGR